MKNNIKYIFITAIIVIVVFIIAMLTIRSLNDQSKLTVNEKKWINTNISTLQNVNVINNSAVFGNNGYGVFYDFITDFSKEYQLKVNPITFNNGETNINDGFKLSNSIDNNSVVFYEDYYVLISKSYEHISDITNINNYNIGVIQNDYSYLKGYVNANLIAYNSYSELNSAFESQESIKYMLVPRYLYLNYTILNEYSFIYHFSDIKSYFIYQMKENDTISTIIKKYATKWNKSNIKKSINTNLLKDLTNSLNLSEKDLATIKSKIYNYGFVNNSPYEVLLSGSYGGIVSEYLDGFSDLTDVEFKFTRYKDYVSFISDVNNKKIDLYFNYYNLNNDYRTIETNMDINYVIVSKKTNELIVNTLSTLKNKEVYVLEDSILKNVLDSIGNVTIHTYKSNDELKKLKNKDVIIMLDKETYNYLSGNTLKNFNIRYSNNSNYTYNFKANSDDSFYRLFSKYVMLLDNKTIKIDGLYNYEQTTKKGTLFGNIAKYILIIIASLVVFTYILYRYKKSNKLKISTKIKKEDKIKFIDQLTSLKNRNYLNENIGVWNKNRIYPQTTIIIDLNRIQDINDSKGYDEGDNQIKAASNILIRTQLDNSDIMRTDGNEFLIYAIGYEKRSIESYIRKLIKEFKNLPFDYGAIITYSMIEDDVKTIEDAINEAVEEMKIKKQEL